MSLAGRGFPRRSRNSRRDRNRRMTKNPKNTAVEALEIRTLPFLAG